MQTYRLTYASVAHSAMDYAALTSLLRAAALHNARADLTGMLVVGNGMFLQALEGDRAVVNRLCRQIFVDGRHRECEVLTAGPVSGRAFAEWSMKLVALDDAITAPRRALLQECAGQREFDPFRMTGDQALQFLLALAAAERRAAA